MLRFQYINEQRSLDEIVKQYQQSDILVLDTEFVRTRTYYAKLGLIQAYDGNTLTLIDPIAIPDLSGFWALLSDQNIIKLIHSCSEDLEVFAHYGKCQPSPLFDSQIAASLCGLGHGLGYAKLVNDCLQVTLDKGESRTDWLKRPLTDAQLLYAANDVYYLYQLYPSLKSILEKQDRLAWVFAEGKRLTDVKLNQVPAELAYQKVKNASQLTSIELAYLKVLAKWRMEMAIKKDLSLGFVVKDHALISLARKQPSDLNSLLRLNELSVQEKRIHGQDLVRVIKAVDLSFLPEVIDILVLRSGYKQAFKIVKEALVAICELQNIPTEMLASKRLIHQYLQWIWDDKKSVTPLVMLGWRGEFTQDKLNSLNLRFSA